MSPNPRWLSNVNLKARDGLKEDQERNIMPASHKEVDNQEDRLRYLDTKDDARSKGKCEGCICYHPDDDLWCHSTEIPSLKCPIDKKVKVVSDKPAKKKSKLESEEEQLSLPIE